MVAFPLESYLNLGEGRKIPSSGILREVFVADALVGNFRGPRRAAVLAKVLQANSLGGLYTQGLVNTWVTD